MSNLLKYNDFEQVKSGGRAYLKLDNKGPTYYFKGLFRFYKADGSHPTQNELLASVSQFQIRANLNEVWDITLSSLLKYNEHYGRDAGYDPNTGLLTFHMLTDWWDDIVERVSAAWPIDPMNISDFEYRFILNTGSHMVLDRISYMSMEAPAARPTNAAGQVQPVNTGSIIRAEQFNISQKIDGVYRHRQLPYTGPIVSLLFRDLTDGQNANDTIREIKLKRGNTSEFYETTPMIQEHLVRTTQNPDLTPHAQDFWLDFVLMGRPFEEVMDPFLNGEGMDIEIDAPVTDYEVTMFTLEAM